MEKRTSFFPGDVLRRLLAVGLVSLLGASSAVSDEESMLDTPREPPGTLEFVGKNLFGRAEGVFHEWRVVESALDLDALEESYALVAVTLESVDTGINRRDAHLRDPDFFEVETYPTAYARGHSLVADENRESGRLLYRAQFDLDLHGVQKTVPGEIEVVSEDPLIVEGRLTLDRLEFGIGPPISRWNPMSIKAEIPVSFRIQL